MYDSMHVYTMEMVDVFKDFEVTRIFLNGTVFSFFSSPSVHQPNNKSCFFRANIPASASRKLFSKLIIFKRDLIEKKKRKSRP